MRESRTYGSVRGAREEIRVPTATEAARVHHAARRPGGVAARGGGAAARARATDSPARFEALEFGPVAPRLPRRRACRRCCVRGDSSESLRCWALEYEPPAPPQVFDAPPVKLAC